jgi:hypothetical protein
MRARCIISDDCHASAARPLRESSLAWPQRRHALADTRARYEAPLQSDVPGGPDRTHTRRAGTQAQPLFAYGRMWTMPMQCAWRHSLANKVHVKPWNGMDREGSRDAHAEIVSDTTLWRSPLTGCARLHVDSAKQAALAD